MNAVDSAANQAVELRVGAVPEPMHAIGGWQTKCAVLQPDSGAVDPLARQQLEMERGVLGVRFEQPEVLVGKIANFVVTENGNIISDSARVRAVFVDGVKYDVASQAPAPAAGGRGGRGGPGGGRGGRGGGGGGGRSDDRGGQGAPAAEAAPAGDGAKA
jgi:hypothetical protein